jgi:hypothetical protein
MPKSNWPSEIRRRILNQHREIETELRLLQAFSDAEPFDLDRVRGQTHRLLPMLTAHRALEDQVLAPALIEADAWGDVRTASLAEHHEVQEAHIRVLSRRILREPVPTISVRNAVSALVSLLEAEMRQEEAELLRPEILRDDVVAMDAMGG